MFRTLVVALVLHGVFTVALPSLIVVWTREQAWLLVELGPGRWLGAGAVLFGAYLYIWSLLRLVRRQTSAIPGARPSVLQVDGWYARVRHPLLLGVVLILLGEAALFESFALLGYALAYWSWLTAFVVLKEEPELRDEFGDAYVAYCQRVRRWIPRVR